MSGTSEDRLSPSQAQIGLIKHYKNRGCVFLLAAFVSAGAAAGLGYSAFEDFKQVSSDRAAASNVILKAAGAVLSTGATVVFGSASFNSYRRSRKHRRGQGRHGKYEYGDGGRTVNYEEIGGP
ncbi:MAG: hypothetical protein H6861_05415 [Rhodospirillales bacterium]|nr:hypothetical protein [Rhodospirillales bacterium]